MVDRLHIITLDHPLYTHAEQAVLACKGGAKLVQLRVKNKPYEEWLSIAKATKEALKPYDVKLIINDSVQIAMEIDADGVHLGKDDMPIHSARMLLGKNKIIGGTANTIEDLIFVRKSGADYAGLGPFSDTTTKENLSAILGLQGYRNTIKALKETNFDIPIIAIGGIRPKDIRPLMVSGVHGIAVASAVFNSAHPSKAVYEILTAIGNSHESPNYAPTDFSR